MLLPVPKVTLVRLELPAKALYPMLVTEPGMVNLSSLPQSEKAKFSMASTLSEMVILVR
jgi:hypothetical protein